MCSDVDLVQNKRSEKPEAEDLFDTVYPFPGLVDVWMAVKAGIYLFSILNIFLMPFGFESTWNCEC